jgi:RsiW-degrading membrane proteinase PrsW (M82 family)
MYLSMAQNSIVSVIFLSVFLGAMPVVFYVWFFFMRRSKKFQKGKNPTALLTLMFFGGIGAVILSFFVERFLIAFLPPEFGLCVSASPECQTADPFTILILAIATFLIVGPVEEGFKFLAAWGISWRSNKFTRIIDGVKYGVAVALGFAAAENALYLFSSLRVLNLNEFVSTFLLRFALSTFAHTLYSGLFGYYLGKAQFQRYGRGKTILTGLFFAVVLHGLFDFVLFSNVGFYAFFIVALMFGVIAIRLRSPENFAVRIPEFLRRAPAKTREKIYVPVEAEIAPVAAGVQEALYQIPPELAPITPQRLRPEFTSEYVPSEFAQDDQPQAAVRSDIRVPETTVVAKRAAQTRAPAASRRAAGPLPAELRPIAPLRMSAASAKKIVDLSADDIKKRRLQVLGTN